VEFAEVLLRRLGFQSAQVREIMKELTADRARALAPQLVD
jgi:hypothetical protein